MKNISKKEWLVAMLVSIVITIIALFIFNITNVLTKSDIFKCLCNSFFVSGFIVLDFGLLTWCSNQGAFVGLTYGFRQIFEKRRFEKAFLERESYGSYRERKLKNQKNCLHMIIIGLGFIAISIIFLLFV